MNEFTTMYHYFKGISDSDTLNSTKNIVIEQQQQKSEKSSPKSSPTTKVPPSPLTSQQMYMEMSGSDQDSGPINAVTNLNYINIENETKDDEMLKNLNAIRLVDEPEEVITNELKILEPPYFESTTAAVINGSNKTDEFSQECSNALENCSGSSLNSSSNENSMGDYLLQPSNKPVIEKNASLILAAPNDFGDYLTHPSNKPVIFNNDVTNNNSSDSDYLIQPSNRKVITPDFDQSHLKFNFKRKDDALASNGSSTGLKSKSGGGGGGTLRRQGSDSSKISVDDELLEIMNDFKNNVFTIQEVEQLVVSWKNRNDVQQSYKDKQEQLQHMRTEYERIQDQIKEKIKRPTPFERVRKLFSRSKSIGRENHHFAADERLTADDGKSTSQHRPMSSLSLQSISSSSSSSGRMSTGSVCSGASLGDSGTHSDHEDRRNIFANACRIGQPGSLIDNYLIPPTPRPVLSTVVDADSKNKSVNCEGVDEIDSSANEHYVLFPSNIPVSPISNVSHEYMNFSGLNTIDETKESGPDIIVLPTVQPIKVQKPETIYGPIRKNVADLCSSFKPVTAQQETVISNNNSVVIINEDHCVQFKNKIKKFDSLSKTNINEMYRNINELDTKTNDQIAKLSKTIDECNTSISAPNTNTSNSHEYMNL